jgi:hypothetical protein
MSQAAEINNIGLLMAVLRKYSQDIAAPQPAEPSARFGNKHQSVFFIMSC